MGDVLSVVSLAKKPNGVMYIDGKSSFTFTSEIVVSIIMITTMLLFFSVELLEINKPYGVNKSSLNDLYFFNMTASSIMYLTSNSNTTRVYQQPEDKYADGGLFPLSVEINTQQKCSSKMTGF